MASWPVSHESSRSRRCRSRPIDRAYWLGRPAAERVAALSAIRREHWGGTMQMNRDFRELLACFAEHDVRYLIVGGWALAAHGLPRYTKDLDLWVMPESANAELVVAALEDFGFGGLGISAADFVQPDHVVQLGCPPNRVYLLTTPDGVDFATCWEDRIGVDLDGLHVPFIGLDGLRENKRSSGRAQDLVDLDALAADG